jgi:hypothetical protein
MQTHPVKVCAWGYKNRTDDPYFGNYAFSNETALFTMHNGATMRICEYREIGHTEREIFRIYGTQASFENERWVDKRGETVVSMNDMRDQLPSEVAQAFASALGNSGFYGGHGGSHAFLVHEFVDAIANNRIPAINVWQAVRYMAAGAVAHKSAMRDGEILAIPDWGEPPDTSG